MMEIRLGLYEKAMPTGLSFEEMLLNVKEAGFDFMEISIDETDARQARLDWSEEEKAEQKELRIKYINGFKESLVSQLEGITVVEPDGSKHKIEKKIKS